jgi:hypothetical protein
MRNGQERCFTVRKQPTASKVYKPDGEISMTILD